MGFIKRPVGVAADGGDAPPRISPVKGDLALEGLWEFLVSPVYDDESPRETGTILIFCEDGLIKACLIDRDNERTAFVSSGAGLKGILERADKGIREDKLDWRRKRSGEGKKGKGR